MNRTSRQSETRGFTLIEVLVAIMILALGATGVAAMQLHALRTAQQSGFQSTALQLAADLAEQVRIQGGATGEAALFDYDAAGDTTASMPSACTGPACELAAWKQRLRSQLPKGRAVLCRDSAPADGAAPRWPCFGTERSPLVIKLGWSLLEKTPAQQTTAPSLLLLVEE